MTLSHPQCYVDIYPIEGGQFTLQQAQLMACVVDKDISGDMGSFQLVLPPGGPNGVNQTPTWAQIITPMSTVVIGISRGSFSGVVMVGVVRSIAENQDWQTGRSVERVTIVRGSDFAYFFTMFSYYSLWYLGATGAGVGIFNGSNPGDSLPTVLGAGLLTGNPGEVGKQWFDTIMAGQNGVMAKTFVRYNDAQVFFPDAVGTSFENYDATIPYGDYFISTEGAWMNKFRMIYPFPFYEFFVTTAQAFEDVSNVSSGQKIQVTEGTKFQSSGLSNDLSGTPFVVARRNPLPQLTTDGSSFDGIDTSLWNSLIVFEIGPDFGFMQSSIVSDDSEIYNFYTLNPTWMKSMFGQSNDSVVPWIFQFASAGDAASIHRYGFRPIQGSFPWMTDITGNIASNGNSGDVTDLASKLLARYASFWEPTAIMSKAAVTVPLRPDIQIGNIFRYQPIKDDGTWDFYITRVTHNFVFGGPSTTSLQLSRGLPTEVYADNGSSGLLFNAHIGNLMKKDGVFTIGTADGASPLQPLNTSQFSEFLSKIGQVYITPQGS